MTAKTHLAFNTAVISALAATGIFYIHDLSDGDAAAIGGVVLGAILVDIDSPNSKILHAIRRLIIPKKYRRFATNVAMSGSSFHHREKCTHWPLFWLALCTVLYMCSLSTHLLPFFIIGVAVGTEAHLFCDMFNPYGIMLLAPFSNKKFRIANIRTDSMGELLFLLISLLTAYLFTTFAFAR